MADDDAPVFARAPALAIPGLLDYRRADHVKVYRSGIKAVSGNVRLAMQASATIAAEREVRFDTVSDDIGVENHCSACILHVVYSREVTESWKDLVERNVKTGALMNKYGGTVVPTGMTVLTSRGALAIDR